MILDVCCGSKMFYFNKVTPNTLFVDQRQDEYVLDDNKRINIKPDVQADFKYLPFLDHVFNLVIFDPPHLRWAGDNSWMYKKYGCLDRENWKEDLGKGFDECWRVLNIGGTLIFKWNESQIKVKRVLSCFSQSPLLGQRTTRNLKTHWIVFHK